VLSASSTIRNYCLSLNNDFGNFCHWIPKLPDNLEELGNSSADGPEWLYEALLALRLIYMSDVSYDSVRTPFRATAGEIGSASTRASVNGSRHNVHIPTETGSKFDARIMPSNSALDIGMRPVEVGYMELMRERKRESKLSTKFKKDTAKMVKSMLVSLREDGGFLRTSLMICGFELNLIVFSQLPAGMYLARFRSAVTLPKRYSPDAVRLVLSEIALFVWLVENWREDPYADAGFRL